MKSCMTMLRVARAYAVGLGARIWKGVRCGYYLTMEELLDLYRSQGFNRRGTAMRRHLGIWMSEDMAVLEGRDDDPSAALWFECPPEKAVLVMVRSEQCGGRCVTGIDRNAWPILRRMHGIQDELEASA